MPNAYTTDKDVNRVLDRAFAARLGTTIQTNSSHIHFIPFDSSKQKISISLTPSDTYACSAVERDFKRVFGENWDKVKEKQVLKVVDNTEYQPRAEQKLEDIISNDELDAQLARLQAIKEKREAAKREAVRAKLDAAQAAYEAARQEFNDLDAMLAEASERMTQRRNELNELKQELGLPTYTPRKKPDDARARLGRPRIYERPDDAKLRELYLANRGRREMITEGGKYSGQFNIGKFCEAFNLHYPAVVATVRQWVLEDLGQRRAG